VCVCVCVLWRVTEPVWHPAPWPHPSKPSYDIIKMGRCFTWRLCFHNYYSKHVLTGGNGNVFLEIECYSGRMLFPNMATHFRQKAHQGVGWRCYQTLIYGHLIQGREADPRSAPAATGNFYPWHPDMNVDLIDWFIRQDGFLKSMWSEEDEFLCFWESLGTYLESAALWVFYFFKP
jgi:hypothetical protein